MLINREMSKRDRKRYWQIWELSKSDAVYNGMFQEMYDLERQYEHIMQELPDEQEDVIRDFVSMCEEMSQRQLEIACMLMRFLDE